MRPSDQLSTFVQAGFAQGLSADVLAQNLQTAGWTAQEIQTALSGWHMVQGLPPIPRPRRYFSARDVFFYAVMFVSLGMATGYLIGLAIDIVDLKFLAHDPPSEWRYRSMRWAIAAVTVFTPLFFVLRHWDQKRLHNNVAVARSAVRKWYVYSAIFCAGWILIGSLLWSIFSLLEGDFTLAFALKLAATVLVAVSVILLYAADIRADRHET